VDPSANLGVEVSAPTADDFVYAISHDLRGPLLNLQGYLRRLRKGCEALEAQVQGWGLTPEQRQACNQLTQQRIGPSLDVLEQNARRMERLVAALLDLSRAGREPPHMQLVSTAQLVQAVVEELSPVAAERKATLRIEGLPELWADPPRVEQILRHLLTNALKFLSAVRPGEITVGGSDGGAEATCWIRDNGIGIKPQNWNRLFVPFGRIGEIEAPGEGIGLAIVHKLVDQQGGRSWVESVHGEGSTFYFALPSAAEHRDKKLAQVLALPCR